MNNTLSIKQSKSNKHFNNFHVRISKVKGMDDRQFLKIKNKRILPKFSILMNQLLPKLYMDNEGQGTPFFFCICLFLFPSLFTVQREKK